ncbi:MAG: VOC family protein [Candidatus Desulfatibia sp.]|uniref:VOC family protein n=1 Tax=Candidatus Desulfatibia sp. TaxID=3101189 RepID=UPI002F30A716
MILKHVALVCGSKENSDKFYEQLLGLKEVNTKILPRELSRQIFDLDSELEIINYADENLHFEIFISDRESSGATKKDKRIEHVCIEIEDMAAFLKKCHSMGVKILQIPKGDKLLVFIKDYDGNLFEIKAKTVIIQPPRH